MDDPEIIAIDSDDEEEDEKTTAEDPEISDEEDDDVVVIESLSAPPASKKRKIASRNGGSEGDGEDDDNSLDEVQVIESRSAPPRKINLVTASDEALARALAGDVDQHYGSNNPKTQSTASSAAAAFLERQPRCWSDRRSRICQRPDHQRHRVWRHRAHRERRYAGRPCLAPVCRSRGI